MTSYVYDAIPAYDEDSGGIARNAVGQVYATTDTTFATPLPVTGLAGDTLANLTTSASGFIPSFRVEDQLVVVWKSGPYEIPLISISGVIARLEAQLAASLAAQEAAEAAAGLSALPAAASDGDVVTYNAGAWVALPPPSGGAGIDGAPAIWPETFPPSAHTTLISELRKGSTASALAAAVVSLLNATDGATARAAIGAGTGNGTSDLTLGNLGTQAMPGNRAFGAAEISVAAGTGLTSATVQAALAELKSLIGTGGTGSAPAGTVVVRRYTAGAYPVRGDLPAGTVVLWIGPVMPTIGGLYAVAGVDQFLATAA